MRARLHVHRARSRVLLGTVSAVALLFGVAWTSGVSAEAATTTTGSAAPSATPRTRGANWTATGSARCRSRCGRSTAPTSAVSRARETPTPGTAGSTTTATTSATTNPTRTSSSNAPGSGSNVNWTLTLGRDPKAAPTDAHPGHDVSDWFELSPAPWFSMALCDPNSFPADVLHARIGLQRPDLLRPELHHAAWAAARPSWRCSSTRRATRPSSTAQSCDATHWCAALTIDSLECTAAFASCNTNCEEPVNFAFIQRNGVPTGPPSPQDSDTKHVREQRRDAAHEPRRQDQLPHVRRARAGRW